ncbi:hybrid sensor histidine kinase/response regulator [Aquabacterium humicola]|uniref:hybrid sensor histidine kinase/response regulator n=1 Tax=Aquabacterium humicola TaxID=3237377 RepID=UPI0025435202|nr:ATP-binding protein [Rubrivivax pictus]
MAPAISFLRTLTGRTLLRLAAAGGLMLLAAAALNATLQYRQAEAAAQQRLSAAAAVRARVAERVLGHTVETHDAVRRAFAERWPAYQDAATPARLPTLLARYPDGAWRNRRELADGRVHPTGWVPPKTALSDELKRLLVLFWDLSSQFGPGAAVRHDNLFFMSVPEESNLGYDPTLFPNWVFDIPAGFSQLDYEWGRLAYRPARPGERSRYATPMVDDVGPQHGPMFQILTPMHLGERHVATVATTLLLKDFLARALPAASDQRQLLFRADGRLIADTLKADPGAPSRRETRLAELGEALAGALLASTAAADGTPRTGFDAASDLYFASARIDGPDWFVATTLPGAAVRAEALRAAAGALAAHGAVLLVLLALLAWILRRHVAAPLGALTAAAEAVAGGDLWVRAPAGRADELGRLASAFNHMAAQVAARDAALRQDKQQIEAALTALQLTDARWRAMTDKASDAIAVVDTPLLLRDVTPPVERMLGLAPAALVGRSLLALVHDDDADTVRDRLQAPDGRPLQFRARDAAGGWRVLEAVASDARAHAAVRGIVLNIRDVSATVEAERQLRQAQKLEAIGTLAGGIAHDFNNMLSAILGYGELARAQAAEGSAQRRHIDASLAAGRRAKSLVERILAFARGGIAEQRPVQVQAVVNEALDAIAASLPAGVVLTRELSGGDAGVVGDPTQVHQLVMNLCTNAVQAMKDAGRLDVRLQRRQLDAPLALAGGTLPAGDALQLTVADTGTGMPPALIERIFDPFFTTKAVGVGTGLGLSLVHRIVGELGGGLRVTSRVGEGSRFEVWLPVRAAVADRSRAAAPAETPRGQGQRVLLVDDEEPLVRLAEELLTRLGYVPTGFTDARAALEALQAAPQRFDLLLSDEAMPGLTGTELARRARALRPDLPIVMCSGYVTPALQQRARAIGVQTLLAKPLAHADIARALAAALGLQR